MDRPRRLRTSMWRGLAGASIASALLGGAAALNGAAGGCIPPELVGAATGADTTSGLDGGGAAEPTGAGGSGGGVSGGGGGAGGPTGLCEDMACAAANGKCMQGACVITCADADSCPDVVQCPAGMPCHVECSALRSCAGGVDCKDANACVVHCSGQKSCGHLAPGAKLTCPAAKATCQLWCQEKDACIEVDINAVAAGVHVVCEAATSCQNVHCSGACETTCGADSACDTLVCDVGPCTTKCAGPNTCKNISCTGGACSIDCSGTTVCYVADCKKACSCSVTCGPGGCAGDAVCPADVSGAGPCSVGKGCTTMGAACDTCP